MTVTADDLRHVRWSLVALLLTAVIGVTAVMAVRHLVDKTDAANRQLTAKVTDIRSRLARARDEELDIRGKIALYQRLQEHGIIGPEARLDWIEQIARIKAERRLLGIDYEILPQAALSNDVLPTGPAAGAYEIMASPMKLRMRLLHENDLLIFLGDLRQAIKAHMLIRECKIDRASAAPAERGPAAQLQADCLIDLITLREKQ
jgi:hypothetical protein